MLSISSKYTILLISESASVQEIYLTDPSNDSENVLLVLDALVFGARVNSCCTHSPATLFDFTLVLANVLPLTDESDAVKEPE